MRNSPEGNLHCESSKDDDDDINCENICDAQGKAEDHGQNAEPVDADVSSGHWKGKQYPPFLDRPRPTITTS